MWNSIGKVFLVLLIVGCNDGPVVPPDPPCEPTGVPDCIEQEWSTDSCSWVGECPPPPPPPIPGPPLTEYIKLEDVPGILNFTNSKNVGLIADLQFNWWAGFNDPIHVVNNCPWGVEPFFDVTPDEMLAFGELGFSLDAIGRDFERRLPKVNKRCSPSHEEYRRQWCKRSEVRRETWQRYDRRLQRHVSKAIDFRNAVKHCRETVGAFDSIKGWCEKMIKAGVRTCP